MREPHPGEPHPGEPWRCPWKRVRSFCVCPSSTFLSRTRGVTLGGDSGAPAGMARWLGPLAPWAVGCFTERGECGWAPRSSAQRGAELGANCGESLEEEVGLILGWCLRPHRRPTRVPVPGMVGLQLPRAAFLALGEKRTSVGASTAAHI